MLKIRTTAFRRSKFWRTAGKVKNGMRRKVKFDLEARLDETPCVLHERQPAWVSLRPQSMPPSAVSGNPGRFRLEGKNRKPGGEFDKYSILSASSLTYRVPPCSTARNPADLQRRLK